MPVEQLVMLAEKLVEWTERPAGMPVEKLEMLAAKLAG